jgi:hemoglobin
MDKRSEAVGTLLDRMGGPQSLNALVGAFYFNVLSDRRIARFFDDVPMSRVIRHQYLFLSNAFGGDNQYGGRTLADAHRTLIDHQGLRECHFDALVEVLADTLFDLGICEGLRLEILAVVESARRELFPAY